MTLKPKNIFLISIAVVLLNTFLWLDSLDTYLSTQYHIALSEHLPESLFKPSASLKKLFAPKEKPEASKDIQANNLTKPTKPNSSESNKSNTQSPNPQSNLTQDAQSLNSDIRILFAGDSMMQGVAPIAISSLRKIQPDGYFEDLSKQSTGLTVNRFLDWPATIKEQIAKKQFNTVVVFLGPNDPWDIYDGKQRYKFPSSEWEEKYRSRVKEILDFAASKHVKIIWIGLPTMREDRLHQGAIIQNKVFREEMKAYGFKYLSTEDLVGSLDQPFKNYIFDANGKEVVVRASDGTHFTPQGLRLISSKLVSMITGLDSK